MSIETPQQDSTSSQPALYMAMELGGSKWKLGFARAGRQKQRIVDIVAGDMQAFDFQLLLAKQKLKLPESAPVYSCYEAGRDGFWIHRYLCSLGVSNVIVDPASIETNRRKKRVKTDRVDVRKLLKGLLRYHRGETDDWSVISIPSPVQEDWRRIHRESERLKKEKTQHTNRLKGLLQTQGLKLKVNTKFTQALENARLFDGSPVPFHLKGELLREYERWQLVQAQLTYLRKQREAYILQLQEADEWLRNIERQAEESGESGKDEEPQPKPSTVIQASSGQAGTSGSSEKEEEQRSKAGSLTQPQRRPKQKARVAGQQEGMIASEEEGNGLEEQVKEMLQKIWMLQALCGIGMESAWLFVMELFGWREFENRRQLGSLSGLTPTPYQSDGIDREQGISKAGNRRVRAMIIQIAWIWLRHQPDSELSQWFEKRFGSSGKRARRIGIVALSRKLLIEFWKYVEKGELPKGAKLKNMD